jgi:hypothetical protein
MKCLKCNKDKILHHDVDFIKKRGMCEECFEVSKGLVKDEDNHYFVPWAYRYWTDTEEPREKEYFEDVNMFIPKISWSEEHKKWKLITSGADCGGYDVQDFEIYFDTKEEIFELMLKGDE